MSKALLTLGCLAGPKAPGRAVAKNLEQEISEMRGKFFVAHTIYTNATGKEDLDWEEQGVHKRTMTIFAFVSNCHELGFFHVRGWYLICVQVHFCLKNGRRNMVVSDGVCFQVMAATGKASFAVSLSVFVLRDTTSSCRVSWTSTIDNSCTVTCIIHQCLLTSTMTR